MTDENQPLQPAPRRPVLIEIDDGAGPAAPETAPPVPDLAPLVAGSAMAQAASLAARPGSRLSGLFWGVAGALAGFILSLAAWDYVTGLLARAPILGGIASALMVALVVLLALGAAREFFAIRRLARLDDLHKAAATALAGGEVGAARAVLSRLRDLYAGRADAEWGLARMAEREAEVLDADGLLGLAETTLLAPLDARAVAEVEAAARHVATVTAIVPLALADVFTALTANLRMIRRIAEIYGGRSGTFGSLRLTRAVLSHLVATGAVAVGDDLIGSVAGGSVLGRVSRRFGEGIVNGALTARVGVAALEVCRPLPFVAVQRPSVTGLVRRALAGLFGGSDGK